MTRNQLKMLVYIAVLILAATEAWAKTLFTYLNP